VGIGGVRALRALGIAPGVVHLNEGFIEELFGETKDWHGLRRFRRRGHRRVQQEALLIGWVLNLKRLAKAQPSRWQPV